MMSEGRIWTDRLGGCHKELARTVPRRANAASPHKSAGLRRPFALAHPDDATLRHLLASPNPIVHTDPDGEDGIRLYTWITLAPRARRVLLWANGVFSFRGATDCEFERMSQAGLWALSLRLPASWRGSYRIVAWESENPPPWENEHLEPMSRRAVMAAGQADPRARDTICSTDSEPCSVISGPEAPPDLWDGAVSAREWTRAADLNTRVHTLTFPSNSLSGAGTTSAASQAQSESATIQLEEHAWVYCPADAEHRSPTPLLVLFDGQVWNHNIELPRLLDQAIGTGALPPLHVAMVDSHDVDTRWEVLGTPGAQVDFVLDGLLDRVRSAFNVSPDGSETIASGQSLGGLSALWLLAMGQGEICRAIAQSPSLWRFDVTEPLAQSPSWTSLQIQAGTREGTMLADARSLAARLEADRRCTGRGIHIEGVEGGHDWAWWRNGLFRALSDLLPRDDDGHEFDAHPDALEVSPSGPTA